MGSVQSALSEDLLAEEIDTQRKDKQDRGEKKKDAKLCHAVQTKKCLLYLLGAIKTYPIICSPSHLRLNEFFL